MLFTAEAFALQFARGNEPEWIEATGKFEAGDAERFLAFIKTLPVDRSETIIALHSPGGNLAEGLRMGALFRKHAISTFVKNGGECYSACAIAFLGGTKQYTTGVGVGRYLEVGAKLGFHGFSAPGRQVVVLNDAFDTARLVNGLIIQYAVQLHAIDAALLSELLTVSPSSIKHVTTSRELRGLGIKIRGTLPTRPAQWPLNACFREVDRIRPIDDGALSNRISTASARIILRDMDELGQQLLNDLFPPHNSKRAAMQRLSAKDLVDLVLSDTPRFPVYRIDVWRGAGLYYDQCYAIATTNRNDVTTLMIDTIGDHYQRQNHGEFGWYNDVSPLW